MPFIYIVIDIKDFDRWFEDLNIVGSFLKCKFTHGFWNNGYLNAPPIEHI